MKFQEFQDTF